MPIYQCQPQTVKLKIVHKFLSGLEGHLNRFALWGNEEYMKIRDDFVAYLQKTYNPLDVVFRLANETSLVLLNGGGFAGPKWSVRVSLANLNEADYVKIGQSIKRVLEQYANVWKASIR